MNGSSLVRFKRYSVVTLGTIWPASVKDASNVSDFGRQVLEYVKGHPGINLLLDFHRVQYLSSAVLAELIRIREGIRIMDGTMRLCALNKNALEVFEITKLDQLFHIERNVKKALADYARHLRSDSRALPDKRVLRSPAMPDKSLEHSSQKLITRRQLKAT